MDERKIIVHDAVEMGPDMTSVTAGDAKDGVVVDVQMQRRRGETAEER